MSIKGKHGGVIFVFVTGDIQWFLCEVWRKFGICYRKDRK